MNEEKIKDEQQVEEIEKVEPVESGTKQEPGKDKEPEKKEPEKRYTDEDVDRIIGEKFARWQKQQEKKISEAEKLAEMNAEEKMQYELDKAQKELAELKAANTRAEMGGIARKMLTEKGYSGVSDQLVAVLVTEDAEETKKNVESFASLLDVEVERAVKERLSTGSPKRAATPKAISKEDILKIKNPQERRKAIQENIHLWDKQ